MNAWIWRLRCASCLPASVVAAGCGARTAPVEESALRAGVSCREAAWPGVEQADELRAKEMDYTIGGQYTLAC